MRLLACLAVGLVALVQVGISFAEMFFWKSEFVQGKLNKVFNFTPEEVTKVEPIVKNAGLYNGFIAAGLAWSLLPNSYSQSLKFFFLSCVAIAGIYGAATLKPATRLLNPATLFLQTLPALVAVYLVCIANRAA